MITKRNKKGQEYLARDIVLDWFLSVSLIVTLVTLVGFVAMVIYWMGLI